MDNRIAAVVLNYNNYNDTIKCVENMRNLNVKADIVIVDNASTNDSFELLRDKFSGCDRIYLIKNETNSGYAAGNNKGFRYIIEKNKNIDYVCIMNPDTLFDDGRLLDRLASKMDHYTDAAVIAPVMIQHRVWDIKHTYWDIPTNWDLLRRQFVLCRKRNQAYLRLEDDMTAYVGVVHGSFLMIRAESLCKIGYLDERTFLYSEENLLALDMRSIGMREMLSIDDHFYHNHIYSAKRIPLAKKIKTAKIASNSRKQICKKYYSHMLIPIMNVLYIINLIVITSKHFGGNLISKFRRKRK